MQYDQLNEGRRIRCGIKILFASFVGILMFLPIRRFAIPTPLPFALDPYRLWLVLLLGTLLFAPRLKRVRSGPLAYVLLLPAIAGVISTAANVTDNSVSIGETTNALAVSVQPWLVYLVSSVVVQYFRFGRERLAELLVICGSIVGVESVFESLTRVNVFMTLGYALPLERLGAPDAVGDSNVRDGVFRASGSAQHPIALAVVLVVLLPICFWLATVPTGRLLLPRRLYVGLPVPLIAGLSVAVSRTGIIALVVIIVLCVVLLPKAVARASIIIGPFVLLAITAFPSIANFFISTLDVSATVSSQSQAAGLPGQGRLVDLQNAGSLIEEHLIFGLGIGSRPTLGGSAENVLDNQYLGTLLNTGALGLFFVALGAGLSIRAAFKGAYDELVLPVYSRLAFAIGLATCSYYVSIAFFDAFAFIQVSLVLALLLSMLPTPDKVYSRTSLERYADVQ